MKWPIVSAVGFLLTTTLVIALARSGTARWERDRIRSRRTRRAAVAPGRRPRGARRLRAQLPHRTGPLARTAARARALRTVAARTLRRIPSSTATAIVWATGFPALRRRLAGAPARADHEPGGAPSAPAEVRPEGGEPAPALERATARRSSRARTSRSRPGRAARRLRRRFVARFRLRHAARRQAPAELRAAADEGVVPSGPDAG